MSQSEDDGLLEQEDWLQKLKSHPIFNDASSSTPPLHTSSRCNASVIINQTDLIVAAGPELRFLSLAKLKASLCDQDATAPANYQLLLPNPASAMPTGPITHLIPNPKPRLLALCSSTHVSVLSLPRPEEQSDTQAFHCHLTSIGPPIRSHYPDGVVNSSGLPRVMKVLWHHSSHQSSTLLILYDLGLVYEYDVSRDTKNPTQIIDFNSSSPISPHQPIDQTIKPAPLRDEEQEEDDDDDDDDGSPLASRFKKRSSHPIKSRTNEPSRLGSFPTKTSLPRIKPSRSASRQSPAVKRHVPQISSRSGTYGPADSASTTAVSMCFGIGTGDWGPLTLYCIMQNGDMYAICPYLPKNAVIPLSYRNSLLFFLTAKLESISNSAADDSLLLVLQKRLYQSLDYLNSLQDTSDLGLDDDYELDDDTDDNRPIYHNSNKLGFHLRPLRQGPFLMNPSPIENNENIEETVSDLVHFRYPPAASVDKQLTRLAADLISDSNSDNVGVFLMAYQSRIDVCLEVEKIEPHWVPSDPNTGATTSTHSELPMLMTYESIDLGLKESLIEPSSREENKLHMVFDVRYNDTIYVYHRLGLHAISTLKWVQSLTQSLPKDHDSEVDERVSKTIREKVGSEVAWIAQTTSPNTANARASFGSSQPSIVSLCVMDDAYLGYAVLALTDNARVITLQLQHRSLNLTILSTPDPTLSSFSASSLQTSSQRFVSKSPSHRHYVSYLEEPWQVPPLLNERPSKLLEPKLKPPVDPTVSTTLRYAGKASAEINQYIRRLIEAANSGQDRIKLQIDEYHKQLDQLFQASEKLESQQVKSYSELQIKRIQEILKNQIQIIQRADIFLQKLTDDRNRNLSKEEIKWFSELNRMKIEVFGLIDDQNGLLNQINQLKTQLNITKSNIIEEIKRRRGESMKELVSSSRTTKLSSFNSSINDFKNSSSFSLNNSFYSHITNNSNTNSVATNSTINVTGTGSSLGKLGESQIIPIYHKLAQANKCIIIIKDQVNKINKSLTKIK